jgi:hypothetical protein
LSIQDYIGKFRPQAFLAITILGALAGYGLFTDHNTVAGAATGGIIALAKDVISADK